MRRILAPFALCALLLGLLTCTASLASAADDAAQPTYTTVTPAGWGIALSLDANGVVSKPGDAGWAGEGRDFLWVTSYAEDSGYPVYQIDGLTLRQDENSAGWVLTDEAFGLFFDNMAKSLPQDPTLQVLRQASGEDFGGRRWHVFNIKETGTDPDTKAATEQYYYSFFFHDSDGTVREVNIYYNAPDAGAVYAIA